ncbi:WD40-repeat-containing domain protein [Cyathus striatus]|nr:WD40-repeat-containing domain protein [Cyathus striatus]
MLTSPVSMTLSPPRRTRRSTSTTEYSSPPPVPPHPAHQHQTHRSMDTHCLLPSSPAPTADYSLIEPDPEYASIFPNLFLPGAYYYPYAASMPTLGSSGRVAGVRRGYAVASPTPGQWLGGGWTQQHQHHQNPLRAILPKLWDVLSFPGRSVLSTLANHAALSPASTSNSSNSSFSAATWSTPTTPVNYIDYADLPPLDGEEGELIDDEACCVPDPYEDAYAPYPYGSGREYGYSGYYGAREVRVATGIDILTLLPSELGLYILTFLCLSPSTSSTRAESSLESLNTILTCQLVSKGWRSLADDNATWKALFTNRWAVDLKKAWARSHVPVVADVDVNMEKSLPSLPGPAGRMSIISATPDRAPLQLNWKRMYLDRVELERREQTPTPTTPTGTDVLPFPGARRESGVEAEGGWEKWDPKVMRICGHSDSVYCLEFDSSRIITGSRDQSIKVWSLRTGALLGSFSGAHMGSVLCLKFEHDWDRDGTSADGVRKKGFMVSGSSDCRICVWDLELGDEMIQGERSVKGTVRAVLNGHSGGVLDLRIDENWIVSCAKDATIHIYNRDTLRLHRVLRGHEGPVNAVGLQGNNIVSASGDGKMILWDIASGERKRTFEGHDRGLACIEFRGGVIVSGSNDCRIKVWNAHTGECVRTLVGHRALVRALALGGGDFDAGGEGIVGMQGRLVSGSYDKTVKVWDLASGRMVREFKGQHTGHIFDVKFDVSRIVSTSHDHNIVVLDFSAGLDTSLFA